MKRITEISIYPPLDLITETEPLARVALDAAGNVTWTGDPDITRKLPFSPHPSESDPLRVYAWHLSRAGWQVRTVETYEEDRAHDADVEARVY